MIAMLLVRAKLCACSSGYIKELDIPTSLTAAFKGSQQLTFLRCPNFGRAGHHLLFLQVLLLGEAVVDVVVDLSTSRRMTTLLRMKRTRRPRWTRQLVKKEKSSLNRLQRIMIFRACGRRWRMLATEPDEAAQLWHQEPEGSGYHCKREATRHLSTAGGGMRSSPVGPAHKIVSEGQDMMICCHNHI